MAWGLPGPGRAILTRRGPRRLRAARAAAGPRADPRRRTATTSSSAAAACPARRAGSRAWASGRAARTPSLAAEHRGRGRAGHGRRAAHAALGGRRHRPDARGHRREPPQERVLHLPARRGLGVLRRPRRGRVLDRHDRRRERGRSTTPSDLDVEGWTRGDRRRRRSASSAPRCSWRSATGRRRQPRPCIDVVVTQPTLDDVRRRRRPRWAVRVAARSAVVARARRHVDLRAVHRQGAVAQPAGRPGPGPSGPSRSAPPRPTLAALPPARSFADIEPLEEALRQRADVGEQATDAPRRTARARCGRCRPRPARTTASSSQAWFADWDTYLADRRDHIDGLAGRATTSPSRRPRPTPAGRSPTAWTALANAERHAQLRRARATSAERSRVAVPGGPPGALRARASSPRPRRSGGSPGPARRRPRSGPAARRPRPSSRRRRRGGRCGPPAARRCRSPSHEPAPTTTGRSGITWREIGRSRSS